jgi:hypothetical protein
MTAPDGTPLPAHDRLVIDMAPKAVARIRHSAATSPLPKTTLLALRNGGRRRIHALPPGLHVPLKEIADGITAYGCTAHEALAGTAPIRGKEAHKSKRRSTRAPQFFLDKVAVPIVPISSEPHGASLTSDDGVTDPEPSDASAATEAIDPSASPGDTIPPAATAATIAPDSRSASAHSARADDGQPAQRGGGRRALTARPVVRRERAVGGPRLTHQ